MRDKIRNGILGFAVADALGVPVEFKSREGLTLHPVNDMREYGTYNQPKGTWSDDTSMTLATMDSLTEGFDTEDMMDCFLAWMQKGSYTPFGEAFDMGNTTKEAIIRYKAGKKPEECGGAKEKDNGNGSLMRILPLAYYLVGRYGYSCEENVMLSCVHQVSALTHRHLRSQIACGIYVMIAITLLKEGNLTYAIHHGIERAFSYYRMNEEMKEELRFFKRISDDTFKKLSEEEIRSSGYVVDTLEAAIWCLLTTNTYRSCVLKAVNLGGDTDTVAAVAGGLAGIAYGIRGIPVAWLEVLKRREYIEEVCEHFSDAVFGVSLQLLLPYESYLLEAACKGSCTQEPLEDGQMLCAYAYPEYEEELNDFILTVENSCYWSCHYIAILNEYGLEVNEELEKSIETANRALLCAILTAYIRQERFQEGLIARAVKERVFVRIIGRMKRLCSKEKPSMIENESGHGAKAF